MENPVTTTIQFNVRIKEPNINSQIWFVWCRLRKHIIRLVIDMYSAAFRTPLIQSLPSCLKVYSPAQSLPRIITHSFDLLQRPTRSFSSICSDCRLPPQSYKMNYTRGPSLTSPATFAKSAAECFDNHTLVLLESLRASFINKILGSAFNKSMANITMSAADTIEAGHDSSYSAGCAVAIGLLVILVSALDLLIPFYLGEKAASKQHASDARVLARTLGDTVANARRRERGFEERLSKRREKLRERGVRIGELEGQKRRGRCRMSLRG